VGALGTGSTRPRQRHDQRPPHLVENKPTSTPAGVSHAEQEDARPGERVDRTCHETRASLQAGWREIMALDRLRLR
jgi:hypothetical protein